MFTLFTENVSRLMSYSEVQFQNFTNTWEKHLKLNITNARPSFIHSEKYIEHLLSLFFVSNTQRELRDVFLNDQVIFLTTLSFYLGQDLKLNAQTETSYNLVKQFLQELEQQGLLPEKLKHQTLLLLLKFCELDSLSDTLESEFTVVNDLLYSTNPVIVLGRACMYYFGEPSKTYFKMREEDKPLLSASLFYDSSFQNSQLIQNKFLRELYTANLHYLMEVQAEKHTFPF